MAEIQYEIEIHEDHRARRSAMEEDAVYEQVEQHQLQFLIFICLPIVSSWSVNVAEPEIQLQPSYYIYTYALTGYVRIVTSLHALSTDADAPEMQHFEHAICNGKYLLEKCLTGQEFNLVMEV